MMILQRVKRLIHPPFHQMQAKRLGEEIVKFSDSSLSLLDVGCGDMVITRFINELAPRKKIMGVDVVDYRQANVPFLLYDGDNLPFEDDSFDTVYAIFVLHHCADEVSVLKEMLRVSKVNVIIIEDVVDSVFGKYVTYLNDWIANRLESPDIPIPFHFHSDVQWKDLFDLLRSRVVYEKRVHQLPFPFNFTRQKLYVIEKSSSRLTAD